MLESCCRLGSNQHIMCRFDGRSLAKYSKATDESLIEQTARSRLSERAPALTCDIRFVSVEGAFGSQLITKVTS